MRQLVWSLADVVVFDATMKPKIWRSLLSFYSYCTTCGPQCRNFVDHFAVIIFLERIITESNPDKRAGISRTCNEKTRSRKLLFK